MWEMLSILFAGILFIRLIIAYTPNSSFLRFRGWVGGWFSMIIVLLLAPSSKLRLSRFSDLLGEKSKIGPSVAIFVWQTTRTLYNRYILLDLQIPDV